MMGVIVACSMNPKSAYRDHLEPQVQDAGIAAQAGKITKWLHYMQPFNVFMIMLDIKHY